MVNKKQKEYFDKEHVLVRTFFRDHSLVQSNLASFNDFITNKIQQITQELNETSSDEDFEIKLGKITIGKPCITEADGSLKFITPAEARLRELTYSAPIDAEISVRYKGQVENAEIRIGKIPVLVKSKVCNLYGLSYEELIAKHEDPKDKGGYFIINGHERAIMMGEDLAPNRHFIEDNKQGSVMLRLFSQRGAYKIPLSITENKEGILEISFSRFKKIPLFVLIKALADISEKEIAELVNLENDGLIINLNEFSFLSNQEDAILKLAEIISMQGTKKEIIDRIKQRIDNYLLPHIGITKNSREEKIKNLCKLVKFFYIAKENPKESITDKDHCYNKKIRLAGDLIADLFRVNLNLFLREIKSTLQKTVKRRSFYSIKTIAKSTLFSSRIESAIATGSWIGEKTGVTQNMKKDNGFAILSQLQKVVSSLAGEQENFAARTVHPTQYGRFCPIETPEGTEIGLRKNLAMLAKVSTETNFPDDKLVKILKEIGMNEQKGEYDIFINGRFVGCCDNVKEFFYQLREKRRKGMIHHEIGLRIDENLKTFFISSETGRVLRPLIVVENGKPKLTENHLKLLKEGIIKWENLIKEGVIDYIDAGEEDNSLIALSLEDLTKDHDYLEVDPVACLGIITSLVPYANHDQAPRLLRGSKTQTQSLGIYAVNYHLRLDTNASILTYPQRPIARSFIYDCIEVYPAGQNIVIAVLPYEGYNIEDALVLNKGSVDRGFARSTFYKPYFAAELNYAGRLKDEFCIPAKDITGYRTEEDYQNLEEDGLTYPEVNVKEGDVLVGKVSPPKFLSDIKDLSIQTKKENSTAVKQEEEGIVDEVFFTQDEEGNKLAAVRLRDQRIPEIGDKFATPHGQKGVVGLIAEEESVPFTVNGIKPDIIFNPHGIPSRMTAGYLLEVLASKVASLSGKIIDATPFCGTSLDSLEENLRKLGFREDGKETMYNAITGEKMEAKIFIGTIYYLKLGRMVKNLLHARSTGKIALLTRQPIEGRAKGGGLRLGEMEQQALVGHGASLLLKERYSADKTIIYICTKCGSLAVNDEVRKKKYCPLCGSNQIEAVDVSYAFKLLVDELQSMHIQTKFELKNKYER